jgi:hypothetical protein
VLFLGQSAGVSTRLRRHGIAARAARPPAVWVMWRAPISGVDARPPRNAQMRAGAETLRVGRPYRRDKPLRTRTRIHPSIQRRWDEYIPSLRRGVCLSVIRPQTSLHAV